MYVQFDCNLQEKTLGNKLKGSINLSYWNEPQTNIFEKNMFLIYFRLGYVK